MRHIVAAVALSKPLIDTERFSTYGKALRTIAYVLRFTLVARKQIPPSEVELQLLAEIRLLRWAQEQHLVAELSALRHGDRVPTNSKLSSYDLFLDADNLLRVKTRLTQGPVFSYDKENPIVVPGESRLAALLIQQAHRVNAHLRFLNTRARQITKSILRTCVACRRRQARTIGQAEAPLPPERIALLSPFSSTGIDFAGPFFVRTRSETHKCYIALFTCCAIRAVHLELVPSQSTEQLLLAVRRFLSSYSGCRAFISDNGKSFEKAATDIKRLSHAVKDATIRDLLANRRIAWDFNCPRASCRGGFFERVIGTVKSALVKTLGRSLISNEEIRTILAELAAVVNDVRYH